MAAVESQSKDVEPERKPQHGDVIRLEGPAGEAELSTIELYRIHSALANDSWRHRDAGRESLANEAWNIRKIIGRFIP